METLKEEHQFFGLFTVVYKFFIKNYMKKQNKNMR